MKHDFTMHQCLSLEEINAYLNKEVSKEDVVAYEQHFERCALCQEVKEEYVTVDQEALTEDLTFINNAISSKYAPKKTVSRRLFISRVAAGLSLLITGTASLFYWNATKSNRLYDNYFQPYDIADLVTRGGEKGGMTEYDHTAIPKSLELAMENYHAGKYKESLPHFTTLLQQQPQNTFATFLNALAHLKEDNVDVAIEQLKTVAINDSNLYEDASWYLALANLKKRNTEEAIYHLEKLEQIDTSFYRDKAIALKNSIK